PPSPVSVAAATARRSSQPLFSPTTLIVGDSITRHIRFFNAATHCFPGATVPVILDKLPSLLDSLPSSIVRVIVHVGSCDTTRQHSELTKKDFNALFSFLKSCGKSVFISGPIPTLGRGIGRFSRILSLHTWLQSACKSQHLGFIYLFWDRPSFFRNDGLHPSRHGNRMLAANIQHAIQCTPHD
uniref:SGNH hydrolase-type esterase domain-containing protein n=1 Tax=Anabas testudineus TaxID=64144 RepID=A0AAQ6ISP4_ANATE